MSLSPERGVTALKVGAALAVGSIAIAGSIEPSFAEKIPKKPKRNELMLDHLAEIIMLDHNMSVILAIEKKPIDYRLHHSGSNHNSTQPHKMHFTSAPLENWLRTLRNCESGGNYSDNTGNGYYGAYQFLLSTWRALGYAGLPSNASPRVQDAAIIRNTDESSGGLATQNPGCYEKTDLSAYPPK